MSSEANPVEIAEDETSGDKTSSSRDVKSSTKPIEDKKELCSKECDSKPLVITTKFKKDDIEDFLQSMEGDDDQGDSDMKLLWDENEGDDDQTNDKLEELLDAPNSSKPSDTDLEDILGSCDKVKEVVERTTTKDLKHSVEDSISIKTIKPIIDTSIDDSDNLNTVKPGHNTVTEENTKELDVEPTEELNEDINTPKTDNIDITLDNSAIAINKGHGLTKPDFMIEIPTQELINCDDISPDCSANTDTPQNVSSDSIEAITVTDIINKNLVTEEEKDKSTENAEGTKEVKTQVSIVKDTVTDTNQEPELKKSMELNDIEINQTTETTDIIVLEPDSDLISKKNEKAIDTIPNADIMESDSDDFVDKNKETPMDQDLIYANYLTDLPPVTLMNLNDTKNIETIEVLDNPIQSIDVSEGKDIQEVPSITVKQTDAILSKESKDTSISKSEVSVIPTELSITKELEDNKMDTTKDDVNTKASEPILEKIIVENNTSTSEITELDIAKISKISLPSTSNASKDVDVTEISANKDQEPITECLEVSQELAGTKCAKVDEEISPEIESDIKTKTQLIVSNDSTSIVLELTEAKELLDTIEETTESTNIKSSELTETSNVDEELSAEIECINTEQETTNQESLITELEPITVQEDKNSEAKSLNKNEKLSVVTEVTPFNNDTNIKEPNIPEKTNITDRENMSEKEPTLQETEDSDLATDVLLEPQPSTSMAPDGSDDDEVTDTLGLLAESSRVVEDDDEQEDDEEADDDDDFDADDDNSSNMVTAEHSEDSNPHQSETDMPKDVVDVVEDKQKETDFQFNEASDEKEQDGDMEDLADESALTEVNEIDIVEHPAGDDLDALNESTKQDDTLTAVTTDIMSAVTDSSDVTEAKSKESSELMKLLKNNETEKEATPEKKSPSKLSNLRISQPSTFLNIVDLDESSSDDEVPEKKSKQQQDDKVSDLTEEEDKHQTTSADPETSELSKKDDEISGMAKTVDKDDVKNKTASEQESTRDVPEKTVESKQTVSEVYNLDSDNEDSGQSKEPIKPQPPPTLQDHPLGRVGCINYKCTGTPSTPLVTASAAALSYFNTKRRKRATVCVDCHTIVTDRTQALVEGVKNMTPLLELEMCRNMEELVEISDSDSDDDCDVNVTDKQKIGESTADFLKENLANIINETWRKYDMDTRLMETRDSLECQLKGFEIDCKEIDTMLNECQVATDKLRKDLYATFEQEKTETPGIHIYDTGVTFSVFSDVSDQMRFTKRKSSTGTEPPAKRSASSVSSSHNNSDVPQDARVDDDNVDVCVVKLSGESAPAGLPPPGEAPRPPLKPGVSVYAMRNAFGAWLKAIVLDVQAKGTNSMFPAFTVCKVKFEHKAKNKVLPARCLAYETACNVRMTIGTRVIALFKDDSQTHKKETYYSGIVSEIPNPVNNYRYLVFFDDGYAQYVQHKDTRLVCECSPLVWEEVHPFSRQFVREYLIAYPERPMVRLHANQTIKTEWNGKWWVSKVMKVDASLVQVHFEEDDRTEWIYRGSTRLAPLYLELKAAERHRARPLPRSTNNQKQLNMPYVEYTRTDEQGSSNKGAQNEELRRQQQRAVAKKSTTQPAPPQQIVPNSDSITSRVVYYTPKNAIRPHAMVTHTCGPRCVRSDVLKLNELRTYNPLAKPLLSGWERQLVRFKGQREVMYRAPCGRRLKNMKELHYYLNLIQSEMSVDLFDFGPYTHCLAEFVLNKCLVSKKDLSHGKERVPVPCVNYYDDSLPEFCSYNTERTPTAGVPLNLDPEFLCGCDCTDDCQDKSKCACWAMTLEGARTIGLNNKVGYVYKRLPEPLPSGIYECNSRCKCKQTCLNRVAQHPLQLKLQVFKTLNRGWGIRALNDVPKGAFLCVYAGNLLTDATANLDGLNEGDEYLAELDYIEVVEQMKEGFEEDIPDADKELDKKDSKSRNTEASDDDDDDETSSSDDERDDKGEKSDDDFRPASYVGVSDMRKTLRKREKKKEKEKEKKSKGEDDCITISDDEELREPSRFMADAAMKSDTYISKYKSVRTLFGKDEACYIMDAKVQGNIGRYLNHSCSPNVFVQNVFVDSHDPRFPWVAFFASCHIKAGTELTWNYNYDVGSVPGKVLYCYCGAPNCRRRLL